MSHTLLLYGATGYSGRLIAAEAARAAIDDSSRVPGYRMVLAGRDGRAVARLAAEHNVEFRVFGIDDRRDVIRGLTGIDVVINAAGPFALTASHLARGALAAGCHYVDINGEAEVYMRTDDLGPSAVQRRLGMVCGAGHTAAASDLLLRTALQELRGQGGDYGGDGRIQLGAVRIASSRTLTLSRGSLETLLRSIREQVRIVRMREVEQASGQKRRGHTFWHEPVGKLERAFDFSVPTSGVGRTKADTRRDVRIASAANLVDTLTARLTVERNGFLAHRIESYVEAGTVGRLVYQFAPLLAPVAALPWSRDLARLPLNVLPAGPTPEERRKERHVTVLEIEDPFQTRIVHWGWQTPNAYDFTAQIVIAVAAILPRGKRYGWLTAAEVLRPTKADLSANRGYLRGCRLHEHHSPVMEAAP
jgi:short subunit dehydrogenase-like uncharacterized protein